MNSSKIYPKITVVTPNYNQGNFLEQTIQSVINQKYPNLEYIIIDGGSTDNSVAIIKKYAEKLTFWQSKKDRGMYDAINKGFLKSTGDIMCWINSDDVLWQGSLHYVAKIFKSQFNIHWLQGFPSVIDEQGKLIYQRAPIQSRYHFYLMNYKNNFTFIQQESTFWTRALWDKTGGRLNLEYSLAADFDLWMRFFKYEKLYCTKKQLAAFRKREGQKSSDQKTYLAQTEKSLAINYKNLSFFNKISIVYYKLLHLRTLNNLNFLID